MIPVLDNLPSLSADVSAYLNAVEADGFKGDIDTSFAARLVMSTDNSIYERLPVAVVYPRDHDDVVCLCRVINDERFKSLSFSARGGGTGTNGQSLTSGIVVDLSRHMTRVLEVNQEEGWVRVEAGLVKDALNDAVREFGLFFAPDTSTSNRATIGGMINTDASGQGSLVYGKTSDHVLGLRVVLSDAEELRTEPVSWVKARALSEGIGSESGLYRQLINTVDAHGDEIDARFPKLNRFLTAYDLKHAATSAQIDLGRLICGSEGSLAIVTEAVLNLEPIPESRMLVNISYDSFDSALRHAPAMVAAKATSVETVDSRVIDLARGDVIWGSVEELINEPEGCVLQGLNMVEFSGESDGVVRSGVENLINTLDRAIETRLDGVIGYQVVSTLDGINRLYTMRKKSVGLLGRSPGRPMPAAFVEDTCVPPERLADYIAEFRALLDSHGLEYGMFGHVDSGVLHVRPIMELSDPTQRELVQTISDAVVELTARYGGLMWGEHGRGYRSEYGPAFFGDRLYAELRKIKAAFDPGNRMNPGKVCTPYGDDASALVAVSDRKRAESDAEVPLAVRDAYAGPVDCNGNGLCFNYSSASPMCPSFKASGDRRYSPKGRAALIREWLRQCQASGVDVLKLERSLHDENDNPLRNLHRQSAGDLPDDFSHEVKAAMDECLACKACTRSCPISVDIPNYRARFLNLYHSRYRRPVRDYLLAWLERSLPWLNRMAPLYNAFQALPVVDDLQTRLLGVNALPRLSSPGVDQVLGREGVPVYHARIFNGLSEQERARCVLIAQDPFNRYFDAQVLLDTVEVLKQLDRRPVLLPYMPTGKPEHVTGFLSGFRKRAQSSARVLFEATQTGVPIIGVEASTVLCYRDEYPQYLPDTQQELRVDLIQEWLSANLTAFESREASDRSFELMIHCTEKCELPSTGQDWQRIFAHFGAGLRPISSGCCGMSGMFGHQSEHQDTSRALFDMSWREPVENARDLLVTGYSCRSQVRVQTDQKPRHPVSALRELLTA